jgi:hypothetical protein
LRGGSDGLTGGHEAVGPGRIHALVDLGGATPQRPRIGGGGAGAACRRRGATGLLLCGPVGLRCRGLRVGRLGSQGVGLGEEASGVAGRRHLRRESQRGEVVFGGFLGGAEAIDLGAQRLDAHDGLDRPPGLQRELGVALVVAGLLLRLDRGVVAKPRLQPAQLGGHIADPLRLGLER